MRDVSGHKKMDGTKKADGWWGYCECNAILHGQSAVLLGQAWDEHIAAVESHGKEDGR